MRLKDYHLKSHDMIYSHSDLNAMQMNLFALMMTAMKEADWQGGKSPEYKFNTDELSEWLGVPKTSLHSALRSPCKSLAQKVISVESKDGFSYTALMENVSYKKGVLTLVPSNRLKDIYIVNSSDKGYARVNNEIFKSLKNPNSKKIFEFLSRYRFDKEMYYLSLEKLKFFLGVTDSKGKIVKKSYTKDAEFMRRVIRPALIEIKENTHAQGKILIRNSEDGEVGFEIENLSDKSGKKIKFLVSWNSNIDEEKKYLAGKLNYIKEKLFEVEDKDTQVILFSEMETVLRKLKMTSDADKCMIKIESLLKEISEEKKLDDNDGLSQGLDELFKI
ncbi:replication initiation protein [Vibrio sp.]|nr:replication initiation protein [Vibrio sp.]